MPRQEWVGIEPLGKIFLLTFPFIGLADFAVLTVGAMQVSIASRPTSSRGDAIDVRLIPFLK
jgi:hypothetical protein